MGPDRMHPQVLRKLAGIMVRPVLTVFESSWLLGEVPEDWKRPKVTPFSRRAKKEDLGAAGW